MMIKIHINKIIFFIIFNLGFMQIIPNYEHKEWEILVNNDIWIGWTDYKKFDWVRSKIILNNSIDDVLSVLDDHKNYKKTFEKIIKCEVNGDNYVYIVVDLPFPFANRDYVVIYKDFFDKDHFVYQYYAQEHEDFPLQNDNIRLPNAAGEWRLIPINDNTTEVIYTWNGEFLGDFPDWALTKAWSTQGQYLLNSIKEELQKRY